MTKLIDRLYINKGDKEKYYDKIDVFKKIGIYEGKEQKKDDRKDQFLIAMAIGFQNQDRIPLKPGGDVLTLNKYLKPEDEALINAVAIKTTGSVDVLSNKEEVYKIAQEYANEGIKFLFDDEKETKFGSFDKKLEKRLQNYYKNVNAEKESELDLYLKSGENEKLEFKSSMLWDLKLEEPNKKLLGKIIAKSIAGFLNTKGGILLVGVSDNGNILGIDNDINILNRKDLDGFQLTLTQLIKKYLSLEFSNNIEIDFAEKDNKKVCIVRVSRSSKPVYLKDGSSKEFYVRTGSSTNPLDIEEANNYIEMNW